MTRVDWNKLLDLCSSVGFQVRNSLVSSVVCQTYTVAVTHRPFTARGKWALTHKSCVTNISQGQFIAVYFWVYFHGYIKKNKRIAHASYRGK